jgi:hypothetical protein
MTSGLDIGKLRFIWTLEFGAWNFGGTAMLDQIFLDRR